MIGLDTNILIRYIIQDDEEQSKLVTNFIENNINTGNPGFVSALVMCEIVWVLKSAYHFTKDEIIKVIRSLLTTGELVIEDSDIVWKILADYRKGKADFSDYYIGTHNQRSGCKFTFTFNKEAARNDFFKLCH